MTSLITYRSTKTVRAMYVNDIVLNSDYTAILTDGAGHELTVSSDYVLREKPRVGGYYMIDGEDFESFIDKAIFDVNFSES